MTGSRITLSKSMTIEVSWSTYPSIDGVAILLVSCRWMVIVGAGVRRNRRPDDFNPMRMRSQDHLLICGENMSNQRLVLGRWHFSETCQTSQSFTPSKTIT